jgi:hypothetical protein
VGGPPSFRTSSPQAPSPSPVGGDLCHDRALSDWMGPKTPARPLSSSSMPFRVRSSTNRSRPSPMTTRAGSASWPPGNPCTPTSGGSAWKPPALIPPFSKPTSYACTGPTSPSTASPPSRSGTSPAPAPAAAPRTDRLDACTIALFLRQPLTVQALPAPLQDHTPLRALAHLDQHLAQELTRTQNQVRQLLHFLFPELERAYARFPKALRTPPIHDRAADSPIRPDALASILSGSAARAYDLRHTKRSFRDEECHKIGVWFVIWRDSLRAQPMMFVMGSEGGGGVGGRWSSRGKARGRSRPRRSGSGRSPHSTRFRCPAPRRPDRSRNPGRGPATAGRTALVAVAWEGLPGRRAYAQGYRGPGRPTPV